ncbi:CocE/NonD family hydrolase [Psychromicrobium sp. YIM B11713]|uniref:CocE/NonD family hydrolase n=1 Tax=Psychromicrobium sp. YIM B11713 TaxID=3145233 RepID=UPI00374F11F7
MLSPRTPLLGLLPVALASMLLVPIGSAAATVPEQPTQLAQQNQTTQPVGSESNPYVPEGALWTQQYFPSTQGVELHADILRPKNLPKNAKTPVILSIGPYFSHFGSTGDEGKTQAGPSTRFNDLVVGGKLMERGYTFVMVDLRGFGGSTGCLDWMGPGEQADVKAALRWAGTQPWSTGAVGMYGKSYDAATGLIGLGSKAPNLKAVVSQEPVYDAYRYLYTNGLERPNHLRTPQAYDYIAQLPPVGGAKGDDAHYAKNAAYEDSHPECVANNDTLTQNPDHQASFWKSRNFLTAAKGSKVPLFLTQGFIESNTEPDGVQQLLQGMKGPVHAWLGQWDHVRGNETNSAGALQMGRAGWFDEVMRFYDKALKGIRPAIQDPAFAIEGSDGVWRRQDSWPQASQQQVVSLTTGSYSSALSTELGGAAESAPSPLSEKSRNNDQNNGQDMESLSARKPALRQPEPKSFAAAASNDLWTASQAVSQATRITGTPSLTVQSKASAGATVAVGLFDVAPDGTAVLINQMVSALSNRGLTCFNLLSLDWTLAKGHRLAVQLTSAEGSQQVTVKSAKLSLSLQTTRWDRPTQGDRSPYLDQYLQWYAASVPTITPSFRLSVR